MEDKLNFEGKMSRRQYWLSFLWYYLVLRLFSGLWVFGL